MKKIMTAAFVLALFTLTACGQGQVPQEVKSTFNNKFPDATNVSWDNENSDEWEAEFKQNGTEYSASFSSEGEWMETENQIDKAQLPSEVAQGLQSKYPGASIEKAEKAERKDGTVYEIEIESDGGEMEVIFDSQGNFVKKESKEEDDGEEED
ncbi:MAG: PepSY-like domain-containing protein [Salegentibacter sp.]